MGGRMGLLGHPQRSASCQQDPKAFAKNLRVTEHATEAARDLPPYFHKVEVAWDAVDHGAHFYPEEGSAPRLPCHSLPSPPLPRVPHCPASAAAPAAAAAHGYLLTWDKHSTGYTYGNPHPKNQLRAYEEGEAPTPLPAALEGLIIPEDIRPFVHFSTSAVLRIEAGFYTQCTLTDAMRGPKLMYKVQPVTFLPPVEPGTPAKVCKGALPDYASPAFSTLSDPLVRAAG